MKGFRNYCAGVCCEDRGTRVLQIVLWREAQGLIRRGLSGILASTVFVKSSSARGDGVHVTFPSLSVETVRM